MTTLINRRYRLTVGPAGGEARTWEHPAKDGGDGLRLTFSVEKTLTSEPNKANIKLYNLSADSRSFLQGKGLEIHLDAGYQDLHGQIFTGQSQLVYSKRDNVDWVTTFELGDGLKFMHGNTVGLALGGQVTLKDAFKSILSQMGIGSKGAEKIPDKSMRGFTHQGDMPSALDRLTRANGLAWSVQDGIVQIHPVGEPVGPEVILINETSGLVGSPDRYDRTLTNPFQVQDPFASPLRGIKFKTLMIPLLTPGMRVQLDSAYIKGIYRCVKVTHSGDSRGGEWYSSVEADVVS